MFKKQMIIAIAFVMTASMLFGCGMQEERDRDQAAYRQYGINCMENKEYEEAIRAFSRALNQSRGKVSVDEIDICYYKAEAQYLAGAYEDAIETYGALIDFNQDPKSYFLRGCLYFQLGQQEKAISDFGMAVSRDQSDYELYIGIYRAMASHNMKSEGEYYLNEALKIKGEQAYDRKQKGRIYLLLNDCANAVANLSEAIEGGEVEANYYLAETYVQMGDDRTADTYYQAYLDAGVADAYELGRIGEHKLAIGEYERALTCLQQALELEEVPNRAEILKAMVIAYEHQYEYGKALTTLEEYLQLVPDDEEALREQTFLLTR